MDLISQQSTKQLIRKKEKKKVNLFLTYPGSLLVQRGRIANLVTERHSENNMQSLFF